MKNKYLLSLDDFANKSTQHSLGGGKFGGLVRIKNLLSEIREKYHLNIQIPKTFAISIDVFDKYNLSQNDIPKELVNLAMHALVACGGNVAIRSSADVEDEGGHTHSGRFDTVLNVKTKAQMRDALKKVYHSAQNVEGAKMGVVIQQMITKPKLAGVVYSETFNAEQDIVIHYVKDKTSEDIIVGNSDGNFHTMRKYQFKSEEDFLSNEISSLSPDLLNNDKMFYDYNKYLELLKKNDKTIDYSNNNPFDNVALYQLNSIIPLIEKSQNNPVDVEFAIIQDGNNMPVIYILQQRPYMNNPNYHVLFANNFVCGYKQDEGSVIEGEVYELDTSQALDNDENIQKSYAGKIILARETKENIDEDENEQNQYTSFVNHSDLFNRYYISHLRNSKAVLSRGSIYDVLYGHCGNNIREDGYPFLVMKNKLAFDDIKHGDYIQINLETGKYQIKPRQNKKVIMPSRER